MTPHHLHALAALHSLAAARAALLAHVAREAAQSATSVLDAAPVLRSPTWGVRQAVGGHGDPTGVRILLADPEPRATRWADIAAKHHARLQWLADQIAATPGPDPWWRIHDVLPRLLPGTVRVITPHLRDEDGWLRGPDVLNLPRPTRPLPGECPACGTRALTVQTAGPETAWTVVCAGRWTDGVHNPCLCVGQGCPCGQDGAVEGVAHIWRRDDVLRAVAGAAPTRTH